MTGPEPAARTPSAHPGTAPAAEAQDLDVPTSWNPAADPRAVADFADACIRSGLDVTRRHPLARSTTLGVGGTAAVHVVLPDLAAAGIFATLLGRTAAADVPLFVLGKGSNTLVSDTGFPGVVTRLGAGHKWLRRDGMTVRAGAGEAMPALAAWAAREGLSGLEFAAGIPATVGGSIRMNAGAHGGDTAADLVDVTLLEPGRSAPRVVTGADLLFGYRTSTLPARAVILAARWTLRSGDPTEIRRRLDELRAWRRATQPLRERNCGSVFANPPGEFAARWIDQTGLKGLRRGGATVSAKHANFITTGPGACAADVFALISAVRAQVRAAGGPLLQPEVRLLGSFPQLASTER